MNRVILIGNGFDLAHGLKTDYNSFIIGYLKNALQKSFESADKKYDDELLSITTVLPGYTLRFGGEKPVSNISELVDFCYERNLKELLYDEWITTTLNQRQRHPFKIRFKSLFFKTLIDNCSHSNWVAIENEFYKELVFCKGAHNRNIVDIDRLTALNGSMKAIINALQEYLKTIDTSPYIKGYEDIIVPIEDRYSNLVLNFNYTNTVEKYLDNITKKRGFTFQKNYIHGKIDDLGNPLIFGFGDELDKNYHEIELINNNLFFKYIKSFWYFNTVNYSSLESFLGMDRFEIYILGHSCGLSDRTLLNTLFEHPKCSRVKIFYYENEKGNNFTELTYEISRHFKSKADMRSKILPFPQCQRMPQIGDVK